MRVSLSTTVVAAATAASAQTGFNWSSVTTSSDLKYHDCYVNLRCARLSLPLDWKNETDTRNVTIAVAKAPAAVPENDTAFGGTIIINPGGPGASGVTYLAEVGKVLQKLLDKPGKKHYEFLSFDPRGIGYSEPKLDCFKGNKMAKYAQLLETITLGAVDQSPGALSAALAAAKAQGERCQKALPDLLPYVGTPNVARDMLAIVDKVDDLRKGSNTKSAVRRDVDAGPRLQYLGTSYGTILGNYFASMFPGRVSRMALDGVVDANANAKGPGWIRSTVDSDKIADVFFKGCFDAKCPLYNKNDTSWIDMKTRVWSWVDSLNDYPLVGQTEGAIADVLIRSGEVRDLFTSAFYSPAQLFRPLAAVIHEAMETGNTTGIVTSLIGRTTLLNDQICNTSTEEVPSLNVDARNAVICVDGDDATGHDLSWWRRYLAEGMSVSRTTGATWAAIGIACSGWNIRPNWEFKGPFKTPQPSKLVDEPEDGRPAAPLLLLSSRFDPVAPLGMARDVSKRHPGSGVLVQETSGHAALFSGSSLCTAKVVADYFDTGVVPLEEKSCQAGTDPWKGQLKPGSNSTVNLEYLQRRWVR